MKYNRTYKTNYNFLKWCEFWLQNNCDIRHTSWKEYYPSFTEVRKNDEELSSKYGNVYMNRDKQFMAKHKDGYAFFDRAYYCKGEWYAQPNNTLLDLFE
jgi:hypothetical protein